VSGTATLAIATLQSVLALFRTRQEQALVELALRQQLAVSLQRRNSSSSEWPRRTTGGHGRSQAELSKLGIRVSLATVSRYLPKAKPDPASSQRWITFLRNHRELIAGMDFLVVPTVRFQLLYVWFAIDHGRRQIPHCNVTANPAARWVIQQLREAFPDESAHRFLILDNDAIFSAEVTGSIANSGIVPRRTALQGIDLDAIEAEVEARNRQPFATPVTAIYSRSDGVVAWRARIDPYAPQSITSRSRPPTSDSDSRRASTRSSRSALRVRIRPSAGAPERPARACDPYGRGPSQPHSIGRSRGTVPQGRRAFRFDDGRIVSAKCACTSVCRPPIFRPLQGHEVTQ
jgi:hypothetical protein